MIRLRIYILLNCLALAGCTLPVSQNERQFDRVQREIERLKATSDIGNNIKVTVSFLQVRSQDRFSVDTLWRYVNENAVIAGRPDSFARSGLKIGVGGDNFDARIRILREQLKSSEESELFLVLADGSRGYISIGQEILVPQFFYSGRWYRSVEYGFRRAGRALEVAVWKLPSGLIEMELTPVFSEFLNNGGDLRMTELSTRVTVSPGQTVVIGGGDSSGQDVATALFGYSRSGENSQTLVTVTAN